MMPQSTLEPSPLGWPVIDRLKPIAVDAPQRSDPWYAARLGNVTASQVSVTLSYYAVTQAQLNQALEIYFNNGIDEEYVKEMSEKYPVAFCLNVGIELKESAARMSYRQTLVAERITRQSGDTDKYVTEEMKWGIINEGIAISVYQQQHQMITKRSPLYLHPYWLCGASPDADVVDVELDEEGNAEVKCLASRNHLYKVIRDDKMPDDYWDQVQMQMWIRGVDWCDFIAYDSRVADGLEIFVKRIPYDPFYIANVMEPGVRRFLDECDHDERVFAAIRKANLEKRKREAEDKAERDALNAQPAPGVLHG